MAKKKDGFDALFSSKKENITEKVKLKKLHCMIDEELKKELDIYAIKTSQHIKDVVSQAIKVYLNMNIKN